MSEDQIFDNQTRAEMPVDFNRPEPAWKKFIREKKVIIASSTALLVIGGIVWFFLSSGNGPVLPTTTNIILQLKGPSQVTSGNEAEYTVIYRNGENADMVNVSLELLYPTGFKFKSAQPAALSSSGQFFNLPMVKEGKDGQVVARGKISGNTGEDKEIKARLRYRLSNFNSEFSVEQSIHTSILPPDLTMEISGPVDVVNGQDTTFAVNITNVTSQDFDNLGIQLNYPATFKFSTSNLAPAKDNNYWKLERLASGSSVSLEISGSFTGTAAEEQLVRADVGQIISNTFAPQLSSTATFRLIPSSLFIKVSSNQTDYIRLGESINYKLEYVNQGRIGLSNLIITVNLNGTLIDLPRITAQNGIITNNTITWKAATLSNLSVLSPNEKGEINFTVPLKNTVVTNLKNQSIIASAQITSEEISKPTKAADVQLKLISELDLEVTGNYVSGAAPMEVGKTTVFNLTFIVSNMSNDLTDGEVIASLPLPSPTWKNIVVPESEKERLTYDPNSGKIRWRLGNIPAFVGKYTPVLQVTFQLHVTPNESDQEKIISLLKDIQASGTDTYVNQVIKADTISQVDTGSIDDDVLNSKGGATVK